MHGLQTVANIGQRAADDDAHGVVEIRLAHLVFEIHGKNFARDFVHGMGPKKGAEFYHGGLTRKPVLTRVNHAQRL